MGYDIYQLNILPLSSMCAGWAGFHGMLHRKQYNFVSQLILLMFAAVAVPADQLGCFVSNFE